MVAIALLYLLPLANVFSAGLVAMTALRQETSSAVVETGSALLLLLALVAVLGGAPGAILLGAGSLWGAALAAGLALRRFGSVDLAAQLLVVLAAAGVLLATAMIPDPAAYWTPILTDLVTRAGLPQAGELPDDWLATLAGLMHGVLAAGLLSTAGVALLIGVWLAGPAGVPEFRRGALSFRLGQVLSIGGILVVMVAAIRPAPVVTGLLLVLATASSAQGLAIVHWWAADRSWPAIWPLLLYGPLLLAPPLAGLLLVVLTAIGLLDNAIRLRRPRGDVV